MCSSASFHLGFFRQLGGVQTLVPLEGEGEHHGGQGVVGVVGVESPNGKVRSAT